jgi:hypothetical protein
MTVGRFCVVSNLCGEQNGEAIPHKTLPFTAGLLLNRARWAGRRLGILFIQLTRLTYYEEK